MPHYTASVSTSRSATVTISTCRLLKWTITSADSIRISSLRTSPLENCTRLVLGVRTTLGCPLLPQLIFLLLSQVNTLRFQFHLTNIFNCVCSNDEKLSEVENCTLKKPEIETLVPMAAVLVGAFQLLPPLHSCLYCVIWQLPLCLQTLGHKWLALWLTGWLASSVCKYTHAPTTTYSCTMFVYTKSGG